MESGRALIPGVANAPLGNIGQHDEPMFDPGAITRQEPAEQPDPSALRDPGSAPPESAPETNQTTGGSGSGPGGVSLGVWAVVGLVAAGVGYAVYRATRE